MDPQPFDSDRYAQLLASARPAVIESIDEHDRLLSIAEDLMEKGDAISVEEEKLLALIVFLVEAFESSIEEDEDEDEENEEGEPPPPPQPHETLRRLMEARGLTPADLIDFFGNPRAAREAVEGLRPITRGQAKQLANYFQVPPKLFYS